MLSPACLSARLKELAEWYNTATDPFDRMARRKILSARAAMGFGNQQEEQLIRLMVWVGSALKSTPEHTNLLLPLQLLHTGLGWCDQHCRLFGFLVYHFLGLETRLVSVKHKSDGEGHTVCEVFYNEAYHLFDPHEDHQEVYRSPLDGHILSREELIEFPPNHEAHPANLSHHWWAGSDGTGKRGLYTPDSECKIASFDTMSSEWIWPWSTIPRCPKAHPGIDLSQGINTVQPSPKDKSATPQQDEIKRILDEREVKQIVCFHCDHFEPHGLGGDQQPIGRRHIRHFLAEANKYPWAAHCTPFFYSQGFALDPSSEQPYKTDRLSEDKEIAEAIREGLGSIEVHLHHEHWTRAKVPPESAGKKLRLLLSALLNEVLRPGDHALDPWLFVHGCWALNASDPDICNIEDEISILSSLGCVGDMSFPAGRRHCDPRVGHPYHIDPNQCLGPGAYKTRHSSGEFLIWDSSVKYGDASLDIGVGPDTSAAWCRDGYVQEGVLFVKTHAHSLSPNYWQSSERTTTPILSTQVANAFKDLEASGIPILYTDAQGAAKLCKI